jgi:tRNA-splicing ligase RtcB
VEVVYDETMVIESIHNCIDFKDMIIRKGAIATHYDELCIIALNMRDGILICKGVGDHDWNESGPHG